MMTPPLCAVVRELVPTLELLTPLLALPILVEAFFATGLSVEVCADGVGVSFSAMRAFVRTVYCDFPGFNGAFVPLADGRQSLKLTNWLFSWP